MKSLFPRQSLLSQILTVDFFLRLSGFLILLSKDLTICLFYPSATAQLSKSRGQDGPWDWSKKSMRLNSNIKKRGGPEKEWKKKKL